MYNCNESNVSTNGQCSQTAICFNCGASLTGLLYIVLHAHALPLGEVVGMVLEWMVKQQFNFFAQPECEMSSPFLVTLSNWPRTHLTLMNSS